jgi:hypothetical protein
LANGAEVSGKYLNNPKRGKLELDPYNLSLLNEIRGEGTPQDKAVENNQNVHQGVRAEIEKEAGTWLDGLSKDALDGIIRSHLKDALNATTDEEQERHQAAIEAVQERLARNGNSTKNGISERLKGQVQNRAAGKEQNRSEATEGSRNEASRPNVDSAAEFNEKYNKHIAPQALPVWKTTQWDGSISFDTLDKKSKDYIEKSGNYVRQTDGKWYDVVNFANGNIYAKLDELERGKENLSKTEYGRQKAILEGVLPKQKAVHDRLFLNLR